jgi:hypothetical protein
MSYGESLKGSAVNENQLHDKFGTAALQTFNQSIVDSIPDDQPVDKVLQVKVIKNAKRRRQQHNQGQIACQNEPLDSNSEEEVELHFEQKPMFQVSSISNLNTVLSTERNQIKPIEKGVQAFASKQLIYIDNHLEHPTLEVSKQIGMIEIFADFQKVETEFFPENVDEQVTENDVSES